MGFVTKSIRLDVSSQMMQDFLGVQTNFSKAVKFLIFDYCSKNGIEDLAQKYNAVSEEAVLNQMMQNVSTTRNATITQNIEPIEKKIVTSSPMPAITEKKEKVELATKEPEKKTEYNEYND